GIVAKYGYDGLVVITIMAGAILVILGLARMGALIKFIPYPVITGFTSGIAVIIFSSQLKDFLGLKMGAVPADFMEKWTAYADHLRTINLPTTLLAAIESLLSAVVADGMIGTRHKSNMELVAQGVANIASPLFGGIPATGAIARTATNIRTGGRTPLAGMTHAVTLLLILVFLGKWAAMVPLCALAAILVVVAYHMSEWRSFAGLLRAPRSDLVVLLLTFALTVFVDLTVAVQVGIVVASLLFMKRMSDLTHVQGITTGDL